MNFLLIFQILSNYTRLISFLFMSYFPRFFTQFIFWSICFVSFAIDVIMEYTTSLLEGTQLGP